MQSYFWEGVHPMLCVLPLSNKVVHALMPYIALWSCGGGLRLALYHMFRMCPFLGCVFIFYPVYCFSIYYSISF